MKEKTVGIRQARSIVIVMPPVSMFVFAEQAYVAGSDKIEGIARQISGEETDVLEPESLIPGWNKLDDGTWRYGLEDGTAKTGWLKDVGSWYYFDSSGVIQTSK